MDISPVDDADSETLITPNTTCTHNQQTDDGYYGDQAGPTAREEPINVSKSPPFPLAPHHCDSNTQGQPEATNEDSEDAAKQCGCGTSARSRKKVDVEKMYTEYMDNVRVSRRTGGIFHREDHQPLQATALSPAPFYDRRDDWANVPRALRRPPAVCTEYSENYLPPERPSVYHQRDFRSFSERQLGEVMETLVSKARHKTIKNRPYDPWGLEPESPPPELLLNTARAARGGLCWFEPVTTRPASDGTAACALRKSLEREHSRQSNLYWNSFYANRNQNHSACSPHLLPCDRRRPKGNITVDENTPSSPPTVGDLQAAFNSRMQNFAVRSRGRQQWIRLSAQERRLRSDSGGFPQKRQPGLTGRLGRQRRPPAPASEPNEAVDQNLNNICLSRAPKSAHRRRPSSFTRSVLSFSALS
ncbi:hypothetical protein SprV_0100441500 [Sparganum proliferum]